MAQPALPTRFPCWVKAVYSWGGESKRDLGFVEGDLIECLNAGDGMWWMGRLRRDRRMVGLFPSNFVQVLDDDFRPTPLRSNPMTPVSGNSSRSNSQTTPSSSSPSKSLFRKPFKSYAHAQSPNPEAAARDLLARSGGTPSPAGSLSSKPKRGPYSSMQKPKTMTPPASAQKSRPPSPKIPAPIARASSPLPPSDYQRYSRASSPAPFIDHQHFSRASSPVPPQHFQSRQPSPAPQQYYNDSPSAVPPPPPPAHRVAYARNHTPEPEHYDQFEEESVHTYRQHARTPSPAPSDQRSGGGFTPSPLRNAMNDVMESLEGMSVSHYAGEQEENSPPINPWSPEAFDEMYSKKTTYPRPHTSLGIGRDQDQDQDDGDVFSHEKRLPELDSFVQRMESQLAQAQHHDSTHIYFANTIEATSPPEVPLKGGSGWSRPPSAFGTRPPSAYGQRPPSVFDQRPSSSQTDSSRPSSSYASSQIGPGRNDMRLALRTRKSAYELGKERLSRTFTTKSSMTTVSAAQSTSTNNSNSTQMTSQSIMSGCSAGGFSATSAGSLARKKFGLGGSIKVERPKSSLGLQNPSETMSGVTYHSSHDSNPETPSYDDPVLLGGLTMPVAISKKRGFLGKMIDSVKTGAATARSNISVSSSSRPSSRQKAFKIEGFSSTSVMSSPTRSAPKDMGLGVTGDWVQMRRDVNRSNSLSQNERSERIERCQLSDVPVLTPVEAFHESVEGDEASDGNAVPNPTDIASCNFSMVDKSARFLNNLPALINASSLSQGYLCRPYKSDVQRLRAIFTWVSERITWEDDFEAEVDTRRVIQTKRGCSEEIAVLVADMCSAIGIHVEIIRGCLKIPGELSLTEDLLDAAARPNHWWNAVIADGEWRILDCALANPTNPRRSSYSSTGNQIADGWWFLARPTEICYTHVPLLPEQQHIVPPVTHDILMALPITSPPYFKNHIQMWDFDTSLLHLEGLEMAHVQLVVPEEIECIATVTARAFARDNDGDFFESGEFITKLALAQGDFVSCDGSGGAYSSFKRYTVKAFVPSSSTSSSFDTQSIANTATLNIYAGRRGLMHSINNNPHPLALSLPLVHNGGPNPDYEFFTRHPTPHALRHELYVTGPLCKRLVFNNTFVFGVRQHPASANWQSVEKRSSSPRPGSAMSMTRPGSAMSMASISISGSAYSNPSSTGSDHYNPGNGTQAVQQKPAKLAIQSPSGKILRMTRKPEARGGMGSKNGEGGVEKVGSNWETIIKIGERGTWRGLVLADRSARWCVFGEWDCV